MRAEQAQDSDGQAHVQGLSGRVGELGLQPTGSMSLGPIYSPPESIHQPGGSCGRVSVIAGRWENPSNQRVSAS